MKQYKLIIALLAGSLLINGCVINKGVKPQVTFPARNAYFLLASSYLDGVYMMDLAIKINLWKNAGTQGEREQIEDMYFSNYKIRQSGDTIRIINLCEIRTYGKNLTDVGTKWRLIPTDNLDKGGATIDVVADDKISIVCDSYFRKYDQANYSYKLNVLFQDKLFKLSGIGEIEEKNAGSMTYSISETEPIVVDKLSNILYHNYQWPEILSGKIESEWLRSSDKGVYTDHFSVLHLGGNAIKVTTNGVSEIYNFISH